MGVHRGAAVLLLAASAARADEANETACRALGFGPSLICSSCTKLGEYVGESDPLVGECQGCCKEEADHAAVVYHETKLKDYPNVQVTYTQGAPPNLFMTDAEGNTVEEIGIANWKVEHIEEFLAEKLAPAPASA